MTGKSSHSLCPDVFILSALIMAASSVLTNAPDLYIDQSYIITTNGNPYVNDPLGFSYTYTYRLNLTNISAKGLLLYGFSTVTPLISYQLEVIQQSSTNANIWFNPRGSDSKILSIYFSVIIVFNSNNYFDLINIYFLSSPNCTNFDVATTKFVFTTPSDFKSYLLLQWVIFDTILANINSHEQFDMSWSLQSSTSLVTARICSYNPVYVLEYKVNLILINTKVSVPVLSSFEVMAYYFTTFSYPQSVYGLPRDDHNCFFGFKWIHYHIMSQWFSVVTNGTTSSVTISGNIYSFYWFFVCLAQCPPSTFILSDPSNCLNCIDYIPNCIDCTSVLVCTKCTSGYVVSPTTKKCFVCNQAMQYCSVCTTQSTCTACAIGNVVQGGCSLLVGCIEVAQQSSASGLISTCIRCDPSQFYLDPFTFTCACKVGFLAGLHCTTVIGCIATKKINNTIECAYCSIFQHFYFEEKLCYCSDGFYLSGDKCADICGDGRVFNLPCDDGNFIDGDGCSSSCTVQKNYKCHAVNTATPSVCQYVGRNVKISLIDTQKSEDANRGIFTFSISPSLPSLQKINISNYFDFKCEMETYQVASWTYSKGKITLQVDYQTDLEDKQASVVFSFNQTYIAQWPITFNFTMISNGEMLIISQTSTQSNIIAYLLLGASCTAGLLLIVGSWFHRMAGVEAINALQVIYYLHYTISSYTPTVKYFQYMSAVGWNNLFFKSAKQNFQINASFMRVNFSMSQTEATLMILAIVIAVASAIVLLFFVPSMFAELIRKIQLLKRVRFFYKRVLFPLSLTILIPALFTIASFDSHSLPDPDLFNEFVRSFLILAIATLISFSFCKEFRQWFNNKQQQEYQQQQKIKQYYIPIFQCYLFIELLLMWLWLRVGIQSCSYALLALCITMCSWQIFVCPYYYFLDNLTIFLNLLLIILFQIFLILIDRITLFSKKSFQLYFIIAFSSLLCLCQLLSVVRVIRLIVKKIKSKNDPMVIDELDNEFLIAQRRNRYQQSKYQLFKEGELAPRKKFINYMERKISLQNHQQKRMERENKEEEPQLKLLKEKLIEQLSKKLIQKQNSL